MPEDRARPAAAPDYDWLIDADTWAFIRQSQENQRVDGELTAESRRAAYDRNWRHFRYPHPEGMTTEDQEIPGPRGPIPIRRYVPASGHASGPGPALILYFHGGGFVVGSIDSHDDTVADLAQGAGCEAISVDYRMAPEFQHPAFFEDCFAAWEWAAKAAQGRPILIAGDSAGGTLAAAVAHAARGRPGAPAGQVLIFPSLGGDPSRGSYVLHSDAPLLSAKDRAFYASQRDMSLVPDDDPRAYPLRDKDFSGLPLTVCIAAQCDPLADDSRDYRDRILAAGGHAIAVEAPAIVHGFMRGRRVSKRCGEAFAMIVESLRAMAEGRKPQL